MKHASKVRVEVPTEGFHAEKCTFLVLSREPGTPITTKICRENKESLETTQEGRRPPQEATDHLAKLPTSCCPKSGRPARKTGRPTSLQKLRQFCLLMFGPLSSHIQIILAHTSKAETHPSSFLDHFLPQICALYAFSNAPREVISRKLSIIFTLNQLKFDFGASFSIFTT